MPVVLLPNQHPRKLKWARHNNRQTANFEQEIGCNTGPAPPRPNFAQVTVICITDPSVNLLCPIDMDRLIITRSTTPIGCCVRLRLLPAAWADQQYSLGHEHVKKTPPTSCTVCNYNVSIRVLQEYVKTRHPGNLTTSDLYYNRFSQLGKPSVYRTPRRPRLQFYHVIFSLVIIRLSRSLLCLHLYLCFVEQCPARLPARWSFEWKIVIRTPANRTTRATRMNTL